MRESPECLLSYTSCSILVFQIVTMKFFFLAHKKTHLCETGDKKWIKILEASNVSMGDLCVEKPISH